MVWEREVMPVDGTAAIGRGPPDPIQCGRPPSAALPPVASHSSGPRLPLASVSRRAPNRATSRDSRARTSRTWGMVGEWAARAVGGKGKGGVLRTAPAHAAARPPPPRRSTAPATCPPRRTRRRKSTISAGRAPSPARRRASRARCTSASVGIAGARRRHGGVQCVFGGTGTVHTAAGGHWPPTAVAPICAWSITRHSPSTCPAPPPTRPVPMPRRTAALLPAGLKDESAEASRG